MSDRSSPRDPASAGAATPGARLVIDTTEFCRREQELEAVTPISQLPRFAEDLFDEVGEVRWQLRGRQAAADDGGVQRRMALHLDVQATVRCDRCLQGLPITYSLDRDYLLMRNEREAAEADADVDDYDVLVGDKHFDVLDLIEDEAIMSQPLQAQHDDCELPAELDDGEPEDRPNPFAVLAKLKKSDAAGGDDGKDQ